MIWYNCKREHELLTAVTSKVDAIEKQETARILRDGAHQLIYEGTPVKVDRRGSSANVRHAFGSVRENVIGSVAEAVTARMVKRRPIPMLTPSDADWTVRNRAKKLNSFIKGKLREADYEAIRPMVIRDAAIVGTGVLKIYSDGDELCIKRVPREELLVEEREGRYGEPRTMFQRQQMPREVLKAWYPDKAAAIDKEGPASRFTDYVLGRSSYADDTSMVDVYEGWHLASGADAKDGRHVIFTKGAILEQGTWERPRFPFAMMHWRPPRQGFWGHGVVENLVPLQQQLDQMMRDSLEALYYGGQLKVFVNRAANINKKHLTGRHPHVIEYDGQPPNYVAGDPVSQQQLQMMDRIKNSMFELEGAPQAFATGQVSVGLNASGVARDAQYDIESERFSLAETQLSSMTIQLARCILDEASAMAAEKGRKKPLRLAWNDRDVMHQIDWTRVKMNDDSYQLTLEPSGYLPDTRHGKLSASNELAQGGVIDQHQVAALMDEPDIQREVWIKAAPYLQARRVAEALGDEDVEMVRLAPDPHWDLPMCLNVAKAYYQRAQNLEGDEGQGAPESVLDRYRQFMTMCVAEIEKNKPAPPPMPPPGMEGAPPMDPNAMPPGAMPPEMMAQMGGAAA